MFLIISAIKEEAHGITAAVREPSVIEFGKLHAVCGKLAGRPAAVCVTGVGKVSTAANLQRLIDELKPAAVVMFGIAGGLNPGLGVGDFIIGEECMQHDFDATSFGFDIGEVPGTGCSVYKADPHLMSAAAAFSGVPVSRGKILTGDRFIKNPAAPSNAYLKDELEGDAVDMEGAAAAFTAGLNGIPFLLIRAVSDDYFGNRPRKFGPFVKKMSAAALDLVCCIIENYRQD